jgi:ABC-type dipeptide/oligopeptide/nickel transport system permease component
MAAIQFGYMIRHPVTDRIHLRRAGMGSAVLNAVVNRDFPVIQASPW